MSLDQSSTVELTQMNGGTGDHQPPDAIRPSTHENTEHALPGVVQEVVSNGSCPPTKNSRRTTRVRRIFSNITSKKEADQTNEDNLRIRRLSLLSVLLNIPADDLLPSWPGALVLIDYIEKQAAQFLARSDGSFIALVSRTDTQGSVSTHSLLVHLVEILRAKVIERPSVNEVLDELLKRLNISVPDSGLTAEVKKDAQQLVFATVGWITMLFTPIRGSLQDEGFHIKVDARISTRPNFMPYDSARRSIAGLIRGLINDLPSGEHVADTTKTKDHLLGLIHVSAINYHALKTFAKINIVWTSSLSEHFAFNRLSRTLMVFRFPTFCAMNCLGKEDENCFSRILADYLHASSAKQAAPELILAALKREIILSYRLLFGHHAKSRHCFVRIQANRATSNEQLDPLLTRLCTETTKELHSLPDNIWPESCRDSDGKLIEQDVYGVDIDFPLFGQRLLDLQAFCLRQQPSRIRDLWRDRRHPTQWLTLWAVLVIGGVTTVLQIIQVLLVVAQLGLQAQE